MTTTARRLLPAVAVLAGLTAACGSGGETRHAQADLRAMQAAAAHAVPAPEPTTTTSVTPAPAPVPGSSRATSTSVAPATTTSSTTAAANAATTTAAAETARPSPSVAIEPIPFGAYYNDVAFSDPQHGWAVGWYTGLIVATDDGGKTWHPQADNTDYELTSVSFLNNRKGWAVGFGGTILTTDDGGSTWRHQAAPAGDYLAASFPDLRHGWAVGNGGLIVATSDGGATWQVQVPRDDFRPALSAVHFVDAQRGWASAPWGGEMLRTTDGGATWTPVPGVGAYALDFLDRNRGWAAMNNEVLRTHDGGATWDRSVTPVPGLFVTDIDFVNRTDGWAVGMLNGEQSFVGSTTDGGVTWEFTEIPGVSVMRGVGGVPSGDAWAVGLGIFPVS